MKLKREKIDDINVLYLEASLTVATAQDVFSEISSLLEEGETRFLLQMSAVEFIDSTGLGTIVRLSKKGGSTYSSHTSYPISSVRLDASNR